MGSESTPDSPALRVAVVLHDLDATLGTMTTVTDRAALLAAVADWLAHHAPTPERNPQ